MCSGFHVIDIPLFNFNPSGTFLRFLTRALQMEGPTDGPTDGLTDGRTNRQTNGRTDERMYKQTDRRAGGDTLIEMQERI